MRGMENNILLVAIDRSYENDELLEKLYILRWKTLSSPDFLPDTNYATEKLEISITMIRESVYLNVDFPTMKISVYLLKKN